LRPTGRAITAPSDLRRATQVEEEHHAALARVEAELSAAKPSAEYAQRLYEPGCGRETHQRAEESAKRAMAEAYRPGQVASVPELAEGELGPATVDGGALATGTAPERRWQYSRPAAVSGVEMSQSSRSVSLGDVEISADDLGAGGQAVRQLDRHADRRRQQRR